MKKKMDKMSVENQQTLTRLTKQIKSHLESGDALTRVAISNATQAIAEKMLCGKALIEAKEIIGHGGFGDWLKEKFGMTDRTARRYMQLANRTHVSEMNEAKTLRQAYILAGIIPEVDNEIEQTPHKDVMVENAGKRHSGATMRVVNEKDVVPTVPPPRKGTIGDTAIGRSKMSDKGAMKLKSLKKFDGDILPIIETSIDDLLTMIKTLPRGKRAELKVMLKPLTKFL